MARNSIWQKIISFFTGKRKPTYTDIRIKDGIWYAKDADGNYLLGIDKSVYDLMGKITFADFPNQLDIIQTNDDLLDIEGDKSVETLKSPISGKIIQRNKEIGQDIERLNNPNPQVNWIVKIAPAK